MTDAVNQVHDVFGRDVARYRRRSTCTMTRRVVRRVFSIRRHNGWH
jgi:hypothetical protein